MTQLLSTALSLLQEPSTKPTVPESPHFWMPVNASTLAGETDWLFDFLYWISVVCSVALLGLMIYFCVKYQAKSRKDKPEESSDHNTAMEVTWSVIPMIVVVAIFVWGFQGFVHLRTAPKDAYEIRATGQKWKWLFEYENGYTDDTLHAPVGRNVRVIISSADVLHSLYLPAFRQKMDAVPGRYTELWFQATEAGEFPIFCTEYCGTGHSNMLSKVVVHKPGGFDKWLEEAQEKMLDLPPAELGELMYQQQGCSTCHSLDGTVKTGPSFKGIFGKNEQMSDGSSVVVDENYIRQSVLEPQAKIVQGFTPAMPTFKGKLNDRMIDGIIAFIKKQK